MKNIYGLIASFIFVFLILILATFFQKKKWLGEEGSRKFVHISVSNWWIIAMVFFDQWIYASIVPFIFIILNYLSYRMNLIKVMERSGEKDLGTVYFPISLLILVLFTFLLGYPPYIGGLGILIMGYGDGFAAIFGKKWGHKKIYQNKSYVGTGTMFVFSLIVSLILLGLYHPVNMILLALIVSIFATLIELYSKKGLDNIFVPILTSLVYTLLLLI